MPRLFHRGEWFYELSPTSLLETEFESLLVQNANVIMPSARIIPYKRTVYDGEASARADLAIISNDYRQWFVVEVEMIRHSLYDHVIPQICTLRGASYGADDADYLIAKDPSFDPQKLHEMMRGQPPDVLVLVNKYDDEWNRELRRYGARKMVFEIFRSDTNRYIFSINGELPQLSHNSVTHLDFDPFLPRFLVVRSPAALQFKSGECVRIFIDEQATEWERVDIQTSCYLVPVGRMPLTRGRKYALVQNEFGEYSICAVR